MRVLNWGNPRKGGTPRRSTFMAIRVDLWTLTIRVDLWEAVDVPNWTHQKLKLFSEGSLQQPSQSLQLSGNKDTWGLIYLPFGPPTDHG